MLCLHAYNEALFFSHVRKRVVHQVDSPPIIIVKITLEKKRKCHSFVQHYTMVCGILPKCLGVKKSIEKNVICQSAWRFDSLEEVYRTRGACKPLSLSLSGNIQYLKTRNCE